MPSSSYKNPRLYGQRAKSLRKQATFTERILWKALREQRVPTGLHFRRQHADFPYIIDFACVKALIAIEIDGFSHDLYPGYDRKREAELINRGWRILRFSNADVESNLESVLQTILTEAGRRYTPTPNPSRKREGD